MIVFLKSRIYAAGSKFGHFQAPNVIGRLMAARSATRAIHSGQLITVDGAAGTVTLEG